MKGNDGLWSALLEEIDFLIFHSVNPDDSYCIQLRNYGTNRFIAIGLLKSNSKCRLVRQEARRLLVAAGCNWLENLFYRLSRNENGHVQVEMVRRQLRRKSLNRQLIFVFRSSLRTRLSVMATTVRKRKLSRSRHIVILMTWMKQQSTSH